VSDMQGPAVNKPQKAALWLYETETWFLLELLKDTRNRFWTTTTARGVQLEEVEQKLEKVLEGYRRQNTESAPREDSRDLAVRMEKAETRLNEQARMINFMRNYLIDLENKQTASPMFDRDELSRLRSALECELRTWTKESQEAGEGKEIRELYVKVCRLAGCGLRDDELELGY